ncbi:glycerol-3-phosphate phosphatase isoform X3 [Oratosquilla oratoria]|uniref:glycerol-3-phosphate phosphatase isoform X3 n=1 Tax=Oratosquilla oratoria TaxID=337810 RepID=UPI003F7709E0
MLRVHNPLIFLNRMSGTTVAQMPQLLDKGNIKKFLDSFDTILTDCDGVIWAGDEVIDRSNEALNYLRSLGKKVFYVTNNSTKTRKEYATKFGTLGFTASQEEIVGASYVMAQYLKQKQFNKKVYVIGTSGITRELDNVNIKHTEVGPDPCPENVISLRDSIHLDPEVGAVVVGFDGHFSFPKIMRASSYLANPDVLFIATNTDERFPVSNMNLVFPGTGAIVRSVETAAERKAVVVGKPSPLMYEVISKENNLDPKRTIMIGDRGNTDILFGRNCGLTTLLVLSGVTALEDVKSWVASDDSEKHSLLSDYYLPTLGNILDLVK